MALVNIFFELIQVAFCREGRLSRELSKKEWYAVYSIAVQQAVTGFSFYGVQKLPREQWPEPQLKFEWIGLAEQIRLQNEKNNKILRELSVLLNHNDVDYVVVKGQIVGEYYPEPLSRQAGDIDFYVVPEDFDRAKQIIKDTWDVTYKVTEGHHHIEFEYQDVPLELHHKLIKLYNKKKRRIKWEI